MHESPGSSHGLVRLRKLRWTEHVALIEMSGINNDLFLQHERRRLRRKPSRRWKDNIKVRLNYVGWEGA